MRFVHVFGGCLVAACLVWLVGQSRDPMRTHLPRSGDPTIVRAQLDRLPPADRALVEAYIRRSRGDVLPVRDADAHEPFTAHDFAEAIELEKAWQVRVAGLQAISNGIQARRDAAMAPLRASVEGRVLRASALSPRQLVPASHPTDGLIHALPSDTPTIFNVDVALSNTSRKTIVGVQGALIARDRDDPLPLDLCWVDSARSIPPGGEVEFRCPQWHRRMDARRRIFVVGSPGRFTVTWEPRKVVFADGTVFEVPLIQ